VGPRASLDRCEKSRPPPGFDPRTVQPVGNRDGEREQERDASCVGKFRSLFPSIIRRNADMMAEMRIHDDLQKSQTGQTADLNGHLRRS
jgi:hypothetical protein